MSLVWINEGQNGYDILSVPAFIAEDLSKYIGDFYDWLRGRDGDNGHRKHVDDESGSFDCLCYDGATDFPRWLNETVLKDSAEKAHLLPRIEFE